ncbi:MAG: GNAT family N-acetyltransferase [Bacteroidota bacterium]
MLNRASAYRTLRTTRLLLRPVGPADAPAVFGIFGDVELMRYWGHPPLTDRAAADVYIKDIHASARAGTLYQWAIAEQETPDPLIGTCTLAGVDLHAREAELGIVLARAYQGAGYATEAAARVIAYGFQAFPLNRILAECDPRNAASISLLRRLDFVPTGHTQAGDLMFERISV